MKKLYILIFSTMIWGTILGQEISEPYDFPIRPLSEAWNNLKDPLERYEVCQIPLEILSNLNTKALIRTCLDFPFFIDVLGVENPQIGFKNVYSRFNGLQELLKREDLALNLIFIYEEMLPSKIDLWPESQQGRFSLNLRYLELTIAQDEVVEKFTVEEITLLRKVAIQQFEIKQKYPNIFGGSSMNMNAYVLAKLLKAENKVEILLDGNTQEELNDYFSTTKYQNSSLINDIYHASKGFR